MKASLGGKYTTPELRIADFGLRIANVPSQRKAATDSADYTDFESDPALRDAESVAASLRAQDDFH
jgi:hypothetical protein